MYRKLILTSFELLFGSDNLSQNGFTVVMVGTLGAAYTFIRPIKDKFEDKFKRWCFGSSSLMSGWVNCMQVVMPAKVTKEGSPLL